MLQPLARKAAHIYRFKRAFRIRLAYGLDCSKAVSISSTSAPKEIILFFEPIFIAYDVPKGHNGLHPSNKSQGEDEAISATPCLRESRAAYSMTFVIPCLVPSARLFFVPASSC